MFFRAFCHAFAILLVAGVCAASIPPQKVRPQARPGRVSDADWMPSFDDHPSCPALRPPRPLATPLPSFRKARQASLKIRFVIGIDGRLHKMAVVNSAGHAADSKAVNVLRHWRYTPAMCNGVPMEAEGTVEFPGNN
jgi:TonB family protein